MSLSNTATPIYYGQFRDAVMRGEIPVCREVSLEMNRIEELIANPDVYVRSGQISKKLMLLRKTNFRFYKLIQYLSQKANG